MINTLSVVNDMLGTLGEAPINDLDAFHPLVPRALATLNSTSFAIQADKWWFNTECPTLIPQVGTNEILLPSDCLSVDTLTRSPNVTLRAGKLYNTDTSSYEFSSSVKVELKRLIPFDLSPATARAYIGARAVQRFQSTIDGDQAKMRALAEEVKLAYITFHSEHIRNIRANLLNRLSTAAPLARMRGSRVRGGFDF